MKKVNTFVASVSVARTARETPRTQMGVSRRKHVDLSLTKRNDMSLTDRSLKSCIHSRVYSTVLPNRNKSSGKHEDACDNPEEFQTGQSVSKPI